VSCPTHHLGAQPATCDLCRIDGLQSAVVMLAADNARMCDIIVVADALADAAEKVEEAYKRDVQTSWRIRILIDTLAKFKQVRHGQ